MFRIGSCIYPFGKVCAPELEIKHRKVKQVLSFCKFSCSRKCNTAQHKSWTLTLMEFQTFFFASWKTTFKRRWKISVFSDMGVHSKHDLKSAVSTIKCIPFSGSSAVSDSRPLFQRRYRSSIFHLLSNYLTNNGTSLNRIQEISISIKMGGGESKRAVDDITMGHVKWFHHSLRIPRHEVSVSTTSFVRFKKRKKKSVHDCPFLDGDIFDVKRLQGVKKNVTSFIKEVFFPISN